MRTSFSRLPYSACLQEGEQSSGEKDVYGLYLPSTARAVEGGLVFHLLLLPTRVVGEHWEADDGRTRIPSAASDLSDRFANSY